MKNSNRLPATKFNTGTRRARPRTETLLSSIGCDDPVPKNMDEFRLALARKIMGCLGMLRRCPERICRRSKVCAGANMRCQRDNPAPRLTPEQEAAKIAYVYRAIKNRLAEETNR